MQYREQNKDQLIELYNRFIQQYNEKRYSQQIFVLDGWSQSELKSDDELRYFRGCFDLLATSGQYDLKSHDPRSLVLIPAWRRKDLRNLTKRGMSCLNDKKEFDSRYFVSGGSVRELLREPFSRTRERLQHLLDNLSQETSSALRAVTGSDSSKGIDRLRRLFVRNNDDSESYTSMSWLKIVDSMYALRSIVDFAPLQTYISAIDFNWAHGKSTNGSAYEAFVHKVFSISGARKVFAFRPYEGGTNQFKDIVVPNNIQVDHKGTDVLTSFERIKQLIDDKTAVYWLPEYSLFPCIDAMVISPDPDTRKGTVLYIQITVGEKHKFNCESLSEIHEIVRSSLDIDVSSWSFKYLAVTPTAEVANKLKLKKIKKVYEDKI